MKTSEPFHAPDPYPLAKRSMDTSQFKKIVGEFQQGEPATIRFYGKITGESVCVTLLVMIEIAGDESVML